MITMKRNVCKVLRCDTEKCHQVVTVQNAASFTLPPPPEFASELRWPEHLNLDTSSSFFLVGLFEDVSLDPSYETL